MVMKTKIKLNRNEARKLKKAQKRKLKLSKVDFYNNDIHLGTRKISANPVNGLILATSEGPKSASSA